MNVEGERRGRNIGEQIDAYDRAVRRAYVRRHIRKAATAAVVSALVAGVAGLLMGGVDVMVRLGLAVFLVVTLIGVIDAGYRIYESRDDDTW